MAEQTIPVKVKHTLSLEIGENAFWIIVWTIVATFVLILVAILTSRSLATDELVAKSADPIATACATGYNSTVNNQCLAFLARKN